MDPRLDNLIYRKIMNQKTLEDNLSRDCHISNVEYLYRNNDLLWV